MCLRGNLEGIYLFTCTLCVLIAKDCETKVDNNQAKPSKRRWVVKPFLIPVLIPADHETT